MKVAVVEDRSRKIASKDHNSHVEQGIDKHKATSVAPLSLFENISTDLQNELDRKGQAIELLLRKSIGEPYFSDSGFFMYEGDSLEFMKQLKEQQFQFDLTVTSPPYNIGKEYEKALSLNEYVNWCAEWMGHVHDITSPNGAFWLNLGYLEVPEKGQCVPIPYLLWDKSSFYLIQEIVWTYGAGVSSKRRLSPRNEKWLFYAKNRDSYTFNLDSIRDPNVKYPNQKKNGKFRCNPLGKNPSDVWEFPKVTTGTNRSSKERTGHPAQFPLGVVERIISACSNRSDVVVDPFAGSFSAGIAAYGLGRIFIGFEKRKDYCDLAIRRFDEFRQERLAAQSQSNLF